MSSWSTTTHKQLLGPRTRHIGDSHCWVLNLNTAELPLLSKVFVSSNLFGNSWETVKWSSALDVLVYHMGYTIMKHIILEYPYTSSWCSLTSNKKDLATLHD